MQTSSITGKPIPAGFTVHREATAEVLVESSNPKAVFVNPIQEFNRDLSIAAIRAWSEITDDEKRLAWEKKQSKRNNNNDSRPAKRAKHEDAQETTIATTSSSSSPSYKPYKFTLFEGLSATGLRSIRYAKEIPALRWVQANDLSPQAAANIRLNADWNDLGPPKSADHSKDDEGSDAMQSNVMSEKQRGKARETPLGKMRVSQGDCCSVLYEHRGEQVRFDIVDLDPYGTASPFIDGAVQAVNDGGLLCVTCTDLAVLAGTNYPEKCFSNYGGVPVKAEYTHEMALRILLFTLATSAGRYGRCIKPVLSLSIDYYVRVFVRVYSSPIQVKKLASQSALVYVCHQCHNSHIQPLGRATERTNQAKGTSQTRYGFASGPPAGQSCSQCDGPYHISGPMWNGELHDNNFIDRILRHIDTPEANYATHQRIRGMLTIARHELLAPFYYIPSKVASLFHATSPALNDVASALLNAGYQVSRSHAAAGSVKTDAPGDFIFDIIREWIKGNPVKMANVKENSPTRHLLDKPQQHEVNLDYNAQVETAMLSNIKLVRYQQNPTAHWGPQSKASGVSLNKPVQNKRKADHGDEKTEAEEVVDDNRDKQAASEAA